jgi:hypothetical protein
MRLPVSAAVALTATLGAIGAATQIAAAPKPFGNPPVRVTLLDRDGDKITSDRPNVGVYENDVEAVRAYIDRSNGSLYF